MVTTDFDVHAREALMTDTQAIEEQHLNTKFLEIFGLTIRQAGARTGWSAQSIREGISANKRRRLFSAEDIVRLRLCEHLWDTRTSDEAAILEQVRMQLSDNAEMVVRSAFARMAEPCHLDLFAELWLLIPDVRRAIDESELDYLPELLQFPGPITIYAGDVVGDELLKAHLGSDVIAAKGSLLTFRQQTSVSESLSSLIGNPGSVARLYLRSKTKFFRSPNPSGGRTTVAFLKMLEDMTPLQQMLML